MAGRPKGRKPRLMLTVPQDLHDLIKEIADARGVPMSSVAVELLSEMQPALEAALPIFKKQKQISDELLKTMEETEKEADNAYNKAVAIEKVKRRLLELQGEWKPNWTDDGEEKHFIQYDHYKRSFIPIYWYTVQQDTSFPYMKDERIAGLIIYELEVELKLIFDIQ